MANAVVNSVISAIPTAIEKTLEIGIVTEERVPTSSAHDWMRAYWRTGGAEAVKSLTTSCLVPAKVVFSYAREFPIRWRSLVGCKIQLLGKGFGEVLRVDGITLWVVFNAAIGEGQPSTSELEEVKISQFERGEVTNVLFPPGSTHVLVHAAILLQASQKPTKTSKRPPIESASVPIVQDVSAREVLAASPVTPTMPLKSRTKAIEDFCRERGVESLLHFTRAENLAEILKYGLVSRTQVDEWRRQSGNCFPLVCDKDRLDGYRNAICVSISFPNYRMFYDQRIKQGGDWVVFQLNAAILWELECSFCPTNAAHSSVSHHLHHDFRTIEALQKMFADTPQLARDLLKIPNYYTTDPQAEVLVFETISTNYIRSVRFQNEQTRAKWTQAIAKPNNISFPVSKDFFVPRDDYKHWQKKQQSASPASALASSSIDQ